MPKRKCTFNVNLQTKYPFIKKSITPSDVKCEKCHTEFSVAHGGASDIKQHLRSEKHKNSDLAAASSSSLPNFFKKTDSPTSKDLEIATVEGAWAYHTVQENHSFRSNDCTSEQKLKCVRMKTEANVNIIAPIVKAELKDYLNECTCVTILTDASNHGTKKIFPVLIRFFSPYEGIKVKLLDFQDQPGETSDIIVSYLMKVLMENNLTSKVIAFCGDNTNCNFGGLKIKGVNDVYVKLNSALERKLIGIECGAHIIHNAIKTAADCLPVDFECIIVKIYSHFYTYCVHVETLKEFCDEVDTEYQKLLGYSKTRWLALMPAIEKVLKLYDPLKNYFLGIDKCPNILRTFFENPNSELWLIFIHSQSAIFHEAVLKIEGQSISAIEASKEIKNLKNNLAMKQSTVFLPHSVRKLITKLQESDSSSVDEEQINTSAADFYKISKEYLEQWTLFFEELEIFEWAGLTKIPTWEEIQVAMDILIQKGFINCNQDTAVFDEYSLIIQYITPQKVTEWNIGNISIESRWVELFQHFRNNNLKHKNFRIIIEYILCLPGTNAPVENLFTDEQVVDQCFFDILKESPPLPQ